MRSNQPPAEPGAFVHELLKAATGALTRPRVGNPLKGVISTVVEFIPLIFPAKVQNLEH